MPGSDIDLEEILALMRQTGAHVAQVTTEDAQGRAKITVLVVLDPSLGDLADLRSLRDDWERERESDHAR